MNQNPPCERVKTQSKHHYPMSDTKIQEQSFGDRGGVIALVATGEVTGDFCALQFIQDTDMTSLVWKGKSTGDDGTGVTFPAGFVFYGHITSFEVSSGSLVAYRKS